MNDALATRQLLSDVTEELGTLAQVPPGWLKLLTGKGAGDQSEIIKLKSEVRSTREMGQLVKSVAGGEYAGFYMTKVDGTPVGIIHYTGEGGKPWRFIKPEGGAFQTKDYRSRAIPRWRVPTRTYTDLTTGQTRSYKPVGQRETVPVIRTDVSLNELSGLIPFQDGVDLYGIKKDVARAAKHAGREATRKGMGTELDVIKKGAAGRFIQQKVGGSLDALKARITDVADKVRERLNAAVASASSGEYSMGRHTPELLSREQTEELNSMLYDLAELNRQIKDASEKGIRGGWSKAGKFNYNYEYFQNALQRVEQALAKVNAGGRYSRESLEAHQLIDVVLNRVRTNEGKHKPGCKCNFCKNLGSFGKKKEKEIDEPKVTENENDAVEAYGVKGMNSARWRKTFKNRAALDKWAEENDAEIQGARKAGPDSVTSKTVMATENFPAPFASPQRGSTGPLVKPPELQTVCDLDHELSGTDDVWDAEVEKIFGEAGVNNFTDLFNIDSEAIATLVGLGNRLRDPNLAGPAPDAPPVEGPESPIGE